MYQPIEWASTNLYDYKWYTEVLDNISLHYRTYNSALNKIMQGNR